MNSKINALGDNPSKADIERIEREYEAKIEEIKNKAEYQAKQKEYEAKQIELQVKNEIKNQKVDSAFKTTEQVFKIAAQAAQVGTQIASAFASDNSTHEEQSQKRLDLSSMEKTRALVKKIKRKNKAMAGGHR